MGSVYGAAKAQTTSSEKRETRSSTRRKKHQVDHEDSERPSKRARAETNKSQWRLRDDSGRLTWHYLEEAEQANDWPQSYADKYNLGLPLVGTL